jgi:ferredoxin-NADP reductase
MAEHSANVTEIKELAPSVIQLSVAFAAGYFEFEPGQWVNFRFPEGVSRAYTIASAPERPDAVQLCVRLGPGKGGTAIKALSPGDTVSIEGPFGDFTLPTQDGRPVTLLAGDVGIAPIRSIVLHMLATKDARPITVLYEPDQRHILYAADFDPLARDGEIVHESGKIETLIARNRRKLESSLKMAAGFDGFLARVLSALRANGIEASETIVETFGPEVG